MLLDIVQDVVIGPAHGAPSDPDAPSCQLWELLGLESGPEGEGGSDAPLDSNSPVLADRLMRIDDKGTQVRVIQPRVVKQPASTGICGYKALFNAVVANHYAGALVRERLFDEAFARWKSGGQPLREQRSLTGDVLERPHIRSIQRDPPSILEDLCDNMTVCLEFGSSSFRQGSLPSDAPAFLDAVARFQDEDAHHHTFLLGLATHWVAVTAIKLPAKGTAPGPDGALPAQSHEYSVVLMDSENHRGLGHAATDVLRRVANFSVWDSSKPRYIPMSFEIPACVDTIEGIQAFVYMLARGITGQADLSSELAHANTRGNLTTFPGQAWQPRSRDPIDADVIAAALGRTPLYSRRVREAKQLEEMFPGRGVELRKLFARQEVADLEAGIARRPDPDDRALSPSEAEAEWRASEAASRAIVAEEGLSDAPVPCAWEALAAAPTEQAQRPHLDQLVGSCLEWIDTRYPLPLALRLLRKLRLAAVPAANAESLRDLASFGEMLGRAGWWSAQSECGVSLSDDQRVGLASLGEEGALLASSAASADD